MKTALDESRDIWVWKEVGNQAMSYRYFLNQGERLPWREEVLSGERYVPFSDLQSVLALRAADAQTHDYLVEQLQIAHRDSALLDSIVSQAKACGVLYPDELSLALASLLRTIEHAVAERAKQTTTTNESEGTAR